MRIYKEKYNIPQRQGTADRGFSTCGHGGNQLIRKTSKLKHFPSIFTNLLMVV